MSPVIIRAQLQAVHLKYNAVYTAYRGCVEALSKDLLAAMRASSDERSA